MFCIYILVPGFIPLFVGLMCMFVFALYLVSRTVFCSMNMISAIGKYIGCIGPQTEHPEAAK